MSLKRKLKCHCIVLPNSVTYSIPHQICTHMYALFVMVYCSILKFWWICVIYLAKYFHSLRRHHLIGIGIPIVNLRRSPEHFSFIIGIPIPIRRRSFTGTGTILWIPYCQVKPYNQHKATHIPTLWASSVLSPHQCPTLTYLTVGAIITRHTVTAVSPWWLSVVASSSILAG